MIDSTEHPARERWGWRERWLGVIVTLLVAGIVWGIALWYVFGVQQPAYRDCRRLGGLVYTAGDGDGTTYCRLPNGSVYRLPYREGRNGGGVAGSGRIR